MCILIRMCPIIRIIAIRSGESNLYIRSGAAVGITIRICRPDSDQDSAALPKEDNYILPYFTHYYQIKNTPILERFLFYIYPPATL